MVTKPELQLVTLKINGEDVTVPAGTTILEACQAVGLEVPNLCYQPLLRPWGSCRLCTVEILGRRGGFVESCAAQVREGMEVVTHSPEVLESRQFLLQMYLVDHALDCPTCDKSGECYLQDNTYLHNVSNNPYRRPKLAQPYQHFSDTIDYKWDRCIICARCTRVCDEVIGVTAIEVAGRGLEAAISPAYGMSLDDPDSTCINCGMCIAVCPVGALTDRKFGSHPWELDATETICGLCDVGCTLNVEHNRGIVRRVTHLWDHGINQGYTCERGKWGYEEVQNPDRLETATIRAGASRQAVDLDRALATVAERLGSYRGKQFAALVSPDRTNEEAYLYQQFARAVMGTNNIDRLVTANQHAVDETLRDSFGLGAGTNAMQEMFTDTSCVLVVGPNITDAAPVASYWVNWAQLYRETKTVVVSHDHFIMADRAALWIQPPEGREADVLNAIARIIIDEGLAAPSTQRSAGFADWVAGLRSVDPEQVARDTGIPLADLQTAARLYATGGTGVRPAEGVASPSVIFHTLAGLADGDDAAPAASALNNLALLTGNVGRPGGGVIAFRGHANDQGALDMGCHPALLPGFQSVQDAEARRAFDSAWLPRWQGGATAVTALPADPGLSLPELIDAIADGRVKALYIAADSHPSSHGYDERLLAVLPKLEFLVVEDTYPSALTELADVALPAAMFLEKDGSFTNADRTIQRVRYAVDPPGDAQPGGFYLQEIADRLGYALGFRHPTHVLEEIARLTPVYHGVSLPRLERGPLQWPVRSFAAEPSVYLRVGDDLVPEAIRFVAD